MDRTISISACGMNKRQVIAIGRQMEDHYRQIIFDCSGFGVEVSSVTLVHQRSLDMAPYIVETSSTDQLTWTITNTDTAYPGYGKAELRITFATGLAKSVVFTTMVIQSITADTTIPQPLQSWYDAMIDYIDDHSVSPEQIEEAVAEYLDEHPVQAPVQSVNGKQGAVVLTASDIGALPDSTQIPTKTSQLQNDSGFLTSAPVESVNGETGDVVITAADLGALTSELDPVFGASAAAGITSADITAWNGKYTKPSGGVPVSDLNSTAQSRLMPTGGTTGQVLAKKSNSNYDTEWVNQSGGGGAVDSVNGKTGTVVLDADDVGALPDNTTASDLGAYVKPTGGIPKTDLASAVQTSLGKADTALQTAVTSFNGNTGAVTYTAPVTSVNGQTGAVSVTVPTKTSDLQNDSGFLTSAPVSSVDGKTGAVTVLPSGGSSGQVLSKASGTDYDVEWTTPQGGGGNDWTLLRDVTTTEDALLQIAITNISVKEVMVYAIEPAGYTSSVVIYCPLNNNEGNHYDKGYGRPMMSLSNSGGSTKYFYVYQRPIVINGFSEFEAYSTNDGSQANIQIKAGTATNVTAGMAYTSMSVATYQTVPAGIRIVVLGR